MMLLLNSEEVSLFGSVKRRSLIGFIQRKQENVELPLSILMWRSGEARSALRCATTETIKSLFNLPGRQAEGFLESLFDLMLIDLPVPDHTTVSRSLRTVTVEMPVIYSPEARHIVVDSTGLKVYGEGEWKVRQHGWCQRRTWRKLHLAVNEGSREIVTAVFSSNDVADCEVFDDLISGVKGNIEQVSADGAYDTHHIFDSIEKLGALASIPPRQNAQIQQPDKDFAPPLPRLTSCT